MKNIENFKYVTKSKVLQSPNCSLYRQVCLDDLDYRIENAVKKLIKETLGFRDITPVVKSLNENGDYVDSQFKIALVYQYRIIGDSEPNVTLLVSKDSPKFESYTIAGYKEILVSSSDDPEMYQEEYSMNGGRTWEESFYVSNALDVPYYCPGEDNNVDLGEQPNNEGFIVGYVDEQICLCKVLKYRYHNRPQMIADGFCLSGGAVALLSTLVMDIDWDSRGVSYPYDKTFRSITPKIFSFLVHNSQFSVNQMKEEFKISRFNWTRRGKFEDIEIEPVDVAGKSRILEYLLFNPDKAYADTVITFLPEVDIKECNE